MEFSIGSVTFSEERTVIIAEAGVNHLGRMDYAENLVAAAKNGGADIIKFQTYKAEKLTTQNAPRFWDWEGECKADGSQYESYSLLDSFGPEQYRQLMRMCKDYEIEFLSTPFDNEAVDMLVDLGMKGFKVASCDVTNIPLLTHIARKGLPVLLSTGASSLDEVAAAVKTLEDNGTRDICVMHCTLCYPTEPQNANLPFINTLKERFPSYIIGFSDHTLGTTVAAGSVIYGVRAIEKHFTFDKTLPYSADHWLSLDEADLRKLVEEVRTLELASKAHGNEVLECENRARQFARRSIVAARPIASGTVLTMEHLAFKRPGTGISPDKVASVVGKVAAKDLEADHIIAPEDIKV